MPKVLVKRGNIDRSDFSRAVLTETVPEDIPIVVSNDGFHQNLIRNPSAELQELIVALIRNSSERYTIPYRYRIRLSPTASRQLSLLHPAAQYRLAQFYGSSGHMIPYFCRHDSISLRRPAKIGSSVSENTTGSGKKRYKGSAIDTLVQDQTVRNPGSFFAYAGYDRLYKFYRSPEFVRLESRFSFARFTDVTKCFSSIYSHTLSWAVKDVQHGKESISADTFANSFDGLMQFSNYNEANGIPVGPEASRLFAEIILQSVDLKIIRRSQLEGLLQGRDFEIRRYIDDYVIFSNSLDVTDTLQRGLEEALGSFNLHLSESKTYTVSRPLQTSRSRVIPSIDRVISEFTALLVRRVNDNQAIVPNRVRSIDAVVKSFIFGVKAACADSGSKYEEVSPYLVGGLSNILEHMVESLPLAGVEAEKSRSDYLASFQVLLECMYFFLAVHMTVRSSYQVAKATIIALRFFSDAIPDCFDYLQDTVRSQIGLILSDPNLKSVKMSDYVPVEVLNIILAATELRGGFQIDIDKVISRILTSERIEYFSCVSLIFYFKDTNQPFITALQRRLTASFIPRLLVSRDAHDAHLCLDLLSCPYLTDDFRIQLLRALYRNLGVGLVGMVEQVALLSEFKNNPWFVNWSQIDILNHLRKKELSAVY